MDLFMFEDEFALWAQVASCFAKIPVSRFADAVLLRTNRFVMGVIVESVFGRRIRRKHLAIESWFGTFSMRCNMKLPIRVIGNDKDWRVSPYNTYTRQGALEKVIERTAKVFTC